jgi:hypothetical protein
VGRFPDTRIRGANLGSMGELNVSARALGGDHISVLDIDRPGSDGLFGLRKLRKEGFSGGDGTLALVGFDAAALDSNTLRFWLVNVAPAVGPDGAYLDAKRTGANATIEIFDVMRGGNAMVHVDTVISDAVYSPNKVAVSENGGFLVTNDHSAKRKWISFVMVFGWRLTFSAR